ncbi:MAG: outer membrane beta-barrel protein [Saprospiraceae bacterium]|nr:outer membrane beta-barrel protein [Saprospiraceae bacterium]
MTFNLFKRLFFSLVLFISISVNAQKNHFGAYFGPTLSALRMEQLKASDVQIDPFDYKFGATFGIFGTLGISDNISIRGELNYERKGGRSGVLLSDGQGNPLPGRHIDEHFDYFQVPALFQLSAGKDFKMFIHIGYAFGYLLHRTDEFPGEINVVIENQQGPPTRYKLFMPETYKKIDHSIVAGIGASPLLSNGMRVQFGLRAYNGKLDIARGNFLRYQKLVGCPPFGA